MTHKRILFTSRNQTSAFDYQRSYQDAMAQIGGNSGNNVFLFSLQNVLQNDDNEVETRLVFPLSSSERQKEIDRINNEYDCVVIAPANAMSAHATRNGDLKQRTEVIKSLKIPVHLIALGAQSSYEYSFKFLESCHKEIKEFIGAALDSGGRIGVRGYFSQEVMRKLGFQENDCSVIGCPSLFIKGGGLQINKPELKASELVPMINGTPVWKHPQIKQYFATNPRSVFVDQDKFYKLLYHPECLGGKELKYLAHDSHWLKMYLAERIKFYGDYSSCIGGIRDLGINFSFGSRIHGNILPLLQNIPSYVVATDSRVRELCEYFDIPEEKLGSELPDLYHFYQKADYTKFNQNFADRYNKFVGFMLGCGIKISPVVKEIPRGSAPEIPQSSKALIVHQAKICRRSPAIYLAYVFYKFLQRLFKGKIHF